MNYRLYILGVLATLFLFSCDEKWEEHYETMPETVDMNMWDAVKNDPNFSAYIQYMQEMQYDTLFQSDDTYTLFIPHNSAFETFTDTSSVTNSVLDYHISSHFIQSGNISGKRKVQTLSEKFALFDHNNDGMYYDGIKLEFESPLYQNGKYFTISQVSYPRPNIYEYFALNNPVFKYFIDSQDSIILDREESRPIGFDDEGNTIYDTVADIYNEFEEFYFPIREEFRSKTATVVFPNEPDYNDALTNMVLEMGGTYTDYSDVPLDWQNDILIPYLLEYGVFENMIEEVDFLTPTNGDTIKLKNIRGDSVVIDYEIGEKSLCSNGYVYNISNFEIPDTLYKGSTLFEGEWLLNQIGVGRYAWDEEVDVISDLSINPVTEFNTLASNDSMLSVNFPSEYDGNYSVEFVIDYLFPREYLMVVKTHMTVGGIYDVYVNDEIVKEDFNYDDYVINRWVYRSVTGKRHRADGVLNIFDCWVDNKAEYGKTKVKFVYKGPGTYVSNLGLVIDYIEFIPADSEVIN
jgi:hypothetical protein